MSDSYGMHVRFRANPGDGDRLVEVLLEAAEGMRRQPDCPVYLVSRSVGDEDTLWVTEAWTSRAAHDASLDGDAAQRLVQRALSLLAEPPSATELEPAGGKGL